MFMPRFDFYEVKKEYIIIFQKDEGTIFTLLIMFIVKNLQKEQNSTNLLTLLGSGSEWQKPRRKFRW